MGTASATFSARRARARAAIRSALGPHFGLAFWQRGCTPAAEHAALSSYGRHRNLYVAAIRDGFTATVDGRSIAAAGLIRWSFRFHIYRASWRVIARRGRTIDQIHDRPVTRREKVLSGDFHNVSADSELDLARSGHQSNDGLDHLERARFNVTVSA